MVSGQRTVVNGQWWSVVSGEWSMEYGVWNPMISGQRSMEDAVWSMGYRDTGLQGYRDKWGTMIQ